MASYFAQCVNFDGEVLGNLQIEKSEKRRCLWSIYVLQHLQGDSIQTSKLMAGMRTPFNTGSGLSQSYEPHRIPEYPRISSSSSHEGMDLMSYTVQLAEVWSLAMAYAANRVGPDTPPPWSLHSDYSIVTYQHTEFDCRVPLVYRYHANRFRDHSLSQLDEHRDFWCAWLFLQFVYEALPCLLNHPFLLSMRLRNFRHTLPQSFIKQSFDRITYHSAWILHLIDIIDHKRFPVCDPTLAHCVVIVATIHLQHSFVENPEFREKARQGYIKCSLFLQRMGEIWPHVKNMVSVVTFVYKAGHAKY